MSDSLRIRMEGGLEAIEFSSAEARRLASRLRRAAGPMGWLFLDRHGLADQAGAFMRDLPRVDDAWTRLVRLGAVEGWPEGRPPRCLEDLRRARLKLAGAAAKACLGLGGGTPTGVLAEDLSRVEAQLRGGPAVVDAPLVVEPADPSAPYAEQWKDFRGRRRVGAALNLIGPAWLVVLAATVSPAAMPVFIAWLVGNYTWASWMGKFACPRCKKPFAERRPLTQTSCDHCGLLRFEGDHPRHRLRG